MNKIVKYTLWIISTLIFLFVIYFAILIYPFLPIHNASDNKNPKRLIEMEVKTLKWGRFAPFPTNRKNFKIQTSGNPFTRTFTVKFSAPIADINEWIKSSESLSKLEPIILTDDKCLMPYDEHWYDNNMNDLISGKVQEQEFYFPRSSDPLWWDIGVINNGLKYRVPYKKDYGIGGPVFINKDTETVYIRISWS